LTTRPEAPDSEADPHLASITRRRHQDVTVFRVRGEAAPTGFVTAFRDFLSDPTPRVLWDMREYGLSRLAHDQIRWLVGQLVRLDLGTRPSGRSAFVCPSEDDHNVMRLLIAFAEANGYRIELAAFRRVEEAQRWLAHDLPCQRSE
jgi:hypothetical protein